MNPTIEQRLDELAKEIADMKSREAKLMREAFELTLAMTSISIGVESLLGIVSRLNQTTTRTQIDAPNPTPRP